MWNCMDFFLEAYKNSGEQEKESIIRARVG